MSRQPARDRWEQAIREDERVTGTTVGVLLTAATYGDRDGAKVSVGHARLAMNIGIDERTVQRALAAGIRLGYLRRVRRGHRLNDDTSVTSEYALTIPERESQPDTGVTLGTVPTGHPHDKCSHPTRHARHPTRYYQVYQSNQGNGGADGTNTSTNRTPATGPSDSSASAASHSTRTNYFPRPTDSATATPTTACESSTTRPNTGSSTSATAALSSATDSRALTSTRSPDDPPMDQAGWQAWCSACVWTTCRKTRELRDQAADAHQLEHDQRNRTDQK